MGMSNRKPISPDKVTPQLLKQLIELRKPEAYPLVISLFSKLKTRRKQYKEHELGFKPHGTEYIFQDFYSQFYLIGRKIRKINTTPEVLAFVRDLAALSRMLGLPENNYDYIMDTLDSITEFDLSNNQIEPLLPDMVYGYAINTQPNALVLKLEYFTGTTVIDILDAHGIPTNTGKARIETSRAKEIALKHLQEDYSLLLDQEPA